ncbi:anti-sigma regulatory factor (Ser/Thr protein kinase) [Jatrophihabitans sp. GAS493]|uniref:ATP-binding protein n=1 Tax=Jatrophihabitans sp. GAS493 TaxID=1907575 RepID=UPI000BC0F0BC|nr:ATP-binding protein [Jatrophihabitans sp. GAS493]SOD73079.1 anti-sigma regulatory factor (Ser/Thr protein kinase) [Jatrophihabitans sp. GAS493]
MSDDILLPPNGDAPRLARSYVAEQAVGIAPGLVEDAELLVSELVTNALRHGRPEILLSVHPDPPGIAVAVGDRGDADAVAPVAADPERPRVGGRGLMIVNAIAARWGVSRNYPPPGKTVWFQLTG